MTASPAAAVGERIADYRVRKGMTQAALAELVGISLSYMKKIERGERSLEKFSLLIDFASALGVNNITDLTGQPLALSPDAPREHVGVPQVRAALVEFTPPALEIPLALDLLADQVVSAWDSWQAPGGFRYAHVGHVLPGLISQARAAVDAHTGADRRRALADASLVYQLTRSWTKRVGEHHLSYIAADRAVQTAREADDPDLAAAAAWNLGQILSGQGHIADARHVAMAAIASLEPLMPDAKPQRLAIYGALHQLAAIQAAREENKAEALRLLDIASKIADRTGETNAFRTAFGPTNVAIHRVAVAEELGDTAEVIDLGQRVDVAQAATVERRTTHWIHTARAYAGRKEDLAAVHLLSRVAAESAEELQRSVPLREVLRELVARETPAIRDELRPLAKSAGLIE